MDFQKSRMNTVVALIVIALGALGTVMLVGGLTGGSGVRIHGVFFLAPVAAVGGVVVLVKSLRAMQVRIDERGILVDHPARRVKVALGWQNVAGATVRQLSKPGEPRRSATWLVVWTHGGLNPGVPHDWGFQHDGSTGYRLLDVDDVRESADQLTEAMRRYAAPVLR
ncbi:hypothetical protein EIL87_13155 [Saccharopolyspora rhizosphaerae]|uniref:PH domain-containing protein n=1 Tax=Saccharopolyspora rhizosphaerae TaxID=2492662 RepID=A0A3R8P402_9PSEU|nr:hypothetical protein [Saccharopolyspora rhizosphaerae]RRO16021.1 hypothetical protein EIL87_13155 [Saccharopolyspora rhizosphaerae]